MHSKIFLSPSNEELVILNPQNRLGDEMFTPSRAAECALLTTNRGRVQPLPERLTHFWLYDGIMMENGEGQFSEFVRLYCDTLEDLVYLPRTRRVARMPAPVVFPALKRIAMSVMWPEPATHHQWHAPALEQLVLYNDGTDPRYGFSKTAPHTRETLCDALRASHPLLTRVLLVKDADCETEKSSIAELNIIEELTL